MLKQKHIAKYLDLSEAEVSRLLSGVRKPSFSQALKFKETFGGAVEEWKNATKEQIEVAFEILTEADIKEVECIS